ncbi:MAG: hypothetical protein ABFS14_07800 [Gemmatimonadota bacterium]
MMRSVRVAAGMIMLLALPGSGLAQEDDWGDEWGDESSLPVEIHGFAEAAVGARVVANSTQPDDVLLEEARFRLEVAQYGERAEFLFKGDLVADGVERDQVIDVRQALVSLNAADWLDVRMGRQVLTWGTGDLVFINDRFPKDFVSFFGGRADEFLKAPSNSARFSFHAAPFDFDFVWTPVFAPDVAISGERLSFFDPRTGQIESSTTLGGAVDPLLPARELDSGEFAGRLHRTVSGYELALYGYVGFTKQSTAFDAAAGRPTFSRLDALGASVRGNLGGGIANLEGAYYFSLDDEDGDDPLVANSDLRALAGYEREVAADFTLGLQYSLVWIQDYDRLIGSSPAPEFEPPEADHTVTARLTRLLRQQTLRLSLFTFYSPSRDDAHLRPVLDYDWSDAVKLSLGGNVLLGPDASFFGQLEQNTNVYARLRYSF